MSRKYGTYDDETLSSLEVQSCSDPASDSKNKRIRSTKEAYTYSKMLSRILLETSSARHIVRTSLLKRGRLSPLEDINDEPTPNPPPIYFMSSSPMKVYNSSDLDDSDYTEPSMCDCQNQLAHYDFNGIVREDLTDLCRRTLGPNPRNLQESSNNGK